MTSAEGCLCAFIVLEVAKAYKPASVFFCTEASVTKTSLTYA